MLAGRSRRGALTASQISSIHFQTPICDIRFLSGLLRPLISIPTGTFVMSFSGMSATMAAPHKPTGPQSAQKYSAVGFGPLNHVFMTFVCGFLLRGLKFPAGLYGEGSSETIFVSSSSQFEARDLRPTA